MEFTQSASVKVSLMFFGSMLDMKVENATNVLTLDLVCIPKFKRETRLSR